MKERSFAESGHEVAQAKADRIGRAAVSRTPVDEGQLWTLSAEDEAVADRLLSMGIAGVGGFVDGGRSGSVWLLRRLAATSLADRLRDRRGPWPCSEALALGLSLARALAACERLSLFPGPITPEEIAVSGTACALRADRLVRSMLGAAEGAKGPLGTEVSPRWTPPEQADGAVWDSAANRYVLGLILYRTLGGEHPFAGAGLRHALVEAAQREPPPFVESVARDLPSGLQSFVLRLLAPEAAERPASAQGIAEALASFLRGESPAAPAEKRRPAPVTDARDARPSPARQAEDQHDRGDGARDAGARDERGGARGGEDGRPERRDRRAEGSSLAREEHRDPAPGDDRRGAARTRGEPEDRRAGGSRALARMWPIAAAVLVAGLSLALLAPPRDRPRAAVVGAEKALGADQIRSQECAQCHSRQASEWRRSVMAHALKSPLFNALEMAIEEQFARSFDCPNGAGALRRADSRTACRDPRTGLTLTGTGGEHWCISCHSPVENLENRMPAWDGRVAGDSNTRRPPRDLLGDLGMEGISCAFCHQVHGPVGPRGSRGYQGNPTWTSPVTGVTFASRPEDARGLFGIANSGYDLRPEELLLGAGARQNTVSPGAVDPVVHGRPSGAASSYLRSSEFCGSCHDVRLFGTDSIGAAKGEHFKRLRNAYTEWAEWAKIEERAGRPASSCQDCHMSTFPGVCEPSGATAPAADVSGAPGKWDGVCPPGTRFAKRAPGSYPQALAAHSSPAPAGAVTHYFSGVDVPLSREYPEALVDEASLDVNGVPLSAKRRRDMLLRAAMRLDVGDARSRGASLEIPVTVENVGAGHKVPAGFSQEREIWVHLVVRDRSGGVVYEVGRVSRGDEDLHDKVFSRVNVSDTLTDRQGRPLGMFGADVRDGPDVPLWDPPPALGGTRFRGKGLINFQNGFLRCVRCIGEIAADGSCRAGPGQGIFRADRFEDGDYDVDTGECRSNLSGPHALFETYFPVGALDSSRGVLKGPDAIIDTRSLVAGAPVTFTYALDTGGRRGPFQVEARLLFRAFPPFLVRGFIDYEREQARKGLRPNGPLVTGDMLKRLEIVEVARTAVEVP